MPEHDHRRAQALEIARSWPTADGEHTVERHHTAGGAEAAAILRGPAAERLGRRADSPGQIPWPGWKAVIGRTSREAISDRVSLVSAGCAFWATLALFPAITMLIFIYGLVFDPATVEPQLQLLARFVPASAFR